MAEETTTERGSRWGRYDTTRNVLEIDLRIRRVSHRGRHRGAGMELPTGGVGTQCSEMEWEKDL